MSDLIDRQAAIEAIEKIPIYVTLDFGETCGEMPVVSPEATLYAIQNLPSAQRTGRWLFPYGDRKYKRCSACGRTYYSIPSNSNYCPNCGTKMEVEHE